jgi:hypothetical protein
MITTPPRRRPGARPARPRPVTVGAKFGPLTIGDPVGSLFNGRRSTRRSWWCVCDQCRRRFIASSAELA